ncbi:MAG: NYN domain-containing protein [Planctomycetes bacterium]|nr:NYN domain-containing protein [Planctomycetota bacterium]
MKPSAVLLIDLENFYCSREDYCRNGPPPGYDRGRFGYDLDKLLAYARSMTADRATGAELPFTVKRAYADFNVAKFPPGTAPQYYLRQLPDELLSQGVEPVQVFRLSRGGGRGGSKNAADMRMAMDATALLAAGGHVEHFVLVTGDADFIPVILELKRHGHTVSVIGVTGATSPKIQRFVDNFELFEDLLAAEEVEARSGDFAPAGDGIGRVAAAVRRLLARTHPLRFAAVKPLLSKELGHPFDPGLFGCDTTGDFLRQHQNALGIVIRQGPHDSEIDLPGGAPNGTNNGSNGSNGSRVPPRSPARPPEKAPDRPVPKSAVPAPEPHTAAHYRQLLAAPRGAAADREGKVYAVPWAALVWACDAVVPLLAPPAGEPTHTTKLQPKLVAATDGASLPDLVKHVRLFYPTLRAGLSVQSADGVYALPEGTTAGAIRRSVLGYIAFVLTCRLTESGAGGDVRPDQLAAVFEPGAALEQAAAEFAAALAGPAPVPVPAPILKPVARPAAEEFHSAAGYVKLLKAGGPKGSETEAFKVLPVPWPSVERICADAFDLLGPAADGAPLPREQLVGRLIEAGKELFVEKYDQHVRRVLGVLRLAGDLGEENGLVTLGADVASGRDLRGRVLAFLLQLLQLRLEEREVYDPIRPQAFVAALEAGPLTDQLIEEVAPAVEWLYKPTDDEQRPAELIAEPVPETPAELPLAEAIELPPDPGADSGVLSVALDPAAPDGNLGLPPSAPAAASAPAGPGGDAYAFDGELPEIDTGNDPLPPEVRHDEERPTEHAVSAPSPGTEFVSPAEEPSGEFTAVNVAQLTSEAVAASGEAPPASKVTPAVPTVSNEPEVEPVVFAPLLPPPPPAHKEPATEVFAAEDILGALPVADWLPDGDPRYTDIADSERPIVLPEPVPTRSAPPPLPLFPLPEEVTIEVDRMKPPPLPPRRVVPPPLPPLPPETA